MASPATRTARTAKERGLSNERARRLRLRRWYLLPRMWREGEVERVGRPLPPLRYGRRRLRHRKGAGGVREASQASGRESGEVGAQQPGHGRAGRTGGGMAAPGLGEPMNSCELRRFEDKIEPEPTSGCWLWTAAVMRNGYGVFGIGGRRPRGRMVLAHRASYEHHVGPIARGLEIDHLCRVRSCVNPTHLRAVVLQENRPAHSYCRKGHDVEADAYVWRGHRYCRKCRNEYGRDRKRG